MRLRPWALLALPVLLVAQTQGPFKPYQLRWWAIQKVTRPAVPKVAHPELVRTPVDAFLLQKLESKGLTFTEPANRITLLRRITFDLTGLPPTPEEIQAFLSDNSPQAYEKVVDRLLASPQYGERWARHWLDVARYADSEGFKSDETRPNIWRYRDYVVASFNADKPYDRFVKEQIAGDELYPGDVDALVATGFNRHFPDESNAANVMNRRQELLNDITDTVGSAFLGVTVGCARCHDHKFDPILQKDYYRLQAFFANTRINDDVVIDPANKRTEWTEKNRNWEEKTKAIRDEMEALLRPERDAFYDERLHRFPQEIQDIIAMRPADRNPYQWQMYVKAKTQITFPDEEIAGKLKGAKKARYAELTKQLAAFDDIKPAPLAVAQVMVDQSASAPPTHVLRGGAWDAPLDEVQPGFLTILDPAPAAIPNPNLPNSTGRRAALANWIASTRNPLTARVEVNRAWQQHFGRGIVASSGDFGYMGDRPTHPELLDYLASSFMENGWSLKKLHREIVLSNAYRQSSSTNAHAAEVDPDNKLLWRFNRQRLEGEEIRDAALAVAGLLNPKMGGPGIFPPRPSGTASRGAWQTTTNPQEADRRSIYVFVRRNARYPMFESFDMPDTHESCSRRQQTVSVTQSLALLNDDLVFDWAKAFAARVSNDSGLSVEAKIDRAFRLAYGRTPTDQELQATREFLETQTGITKDQQKALTDLCHVLFNSNEFLYVD